MVSSPLLLSRVVGRHRQVLLNAVTATGTAEMTVPGDLFAYRKHLFYVMSASVSSGATLRIQAQGVLGNWIDLHVQTISANGSFAISLEGGWSAIRANLSARTDGTYTVTVDSLG